MPELPGSLRPVSASPFVGRSVALGRLRTLMPRTGERSQRIVLLGGEAGSGKSRLIREYAVEAAAGGALVLSGSADAVVRTPYGPFVEALDQLSHAIEPVELCSALGAG